MKKPWTFKPQTDKEREKFLGEFDKTSNDSKSLIMLSKYFKIMGKPQWGEWLDGHKECGQSYNQYQKIPNNKVTKAKNTIYIQPLEQMPNFFLKGLKRYCEAFFYGCQVKLNPIKQLDTLKVSKRINEYSEKVQYHGIQIIKKMFGQHKACKDAYCTACVMNQDMAPNFRWNFAYGYAYFKPKVGLFSFARYDDNFEEEQDKNYKKDWNKILYEACRVLTHEIGHNFYLKHCISYRCHMNGYSGKEENLEKPPYLCPICLRKLQSNIGFNLLERYKALQKVQKSFEYKQFHEDAKRLQEIIQDMEKIQKPFKANNSKTTSKSMKNYSNQKVSRPIKNKRKLHVVTKKIINKNKNKKPRWS